MKTGKVALLLSLAAAISGCSNADAPQPGTTSRTTSGAHPTFTTAPNAVPSGRQGAPRGGLVAVADESQVDAVAQAIAHTSLRVDTTLDASPQDAVRRATRWMDPSLAETQNALVSGGGAWWTKLSTKRGWTTTTVRADPEPPPDLGPNRAVRRVYVAGATHPEVENTAWVVEMELHRDSSGRWRASRFRMSRT